MKKKNIVKIMKNPSLIIKGLGSRGLLNWLSDDIYLKLIYKSALKKELNLKNPINYNERLQWLKINDRKTHYTKYVDKLEVRGLISNKIGEKYLIPLLGVYETVDDIDWEMLPEQFVLKCTHGSGTNIICSNKSNLNVNHSIKQLKKWMNKNWYWVGREWPYKNIKPKIICEKYMVENEGEELKDYRVFCFDGEPKFIAVDFEINNKEKTRRNLYDLEWNFLENEISYPRELGIDVKRPFQLENMVNISKFLSKDMAHVRIDFYSIGEEIYFGEMTFYHQLGLAKISPEEFSDKMGSWIPIN